MSPEPQSTKRLLKALAQTDMHENPEGLGSLAVRTGSALIRRCDLCGNVNAIDLDWSEQHEREMQLEDHTVMRVTEAEALELWKFAKRCDHKAYIKKLESLVALQNTKLTDAERSV